MTVSFCLFQLCRYLCIARACCGLKRVPVRGCSRKCPGTAIWRFFMAMQSPLTSRPMPPNPRSSPSPKSRPGGWTPPPRAMTAPAVIISTPRQSSVPWWTDISRASALRCLLLPATAVPSPQPQPVWGERNKKAKIQDYKRETTQMQHYKMKATWRGKTGLRATCKWSLVRSRCDKHRSPLYLIGSRGEKMFS